MNAPAIQFQFSGAFATVFDLYVICRARRKGAHCPLHGVPIVLKDNIDAENRFALDSKILTQSWC